LEDEIVINVNKKTKANNKKTNKKNTKKVKNNKKNKLFFKRIKVIGITVGVITVSIILFSSSLFNIKKIDVEGNEGISDEKIISLSSIELYTNIFKINKNDIIKKIKENAYIEDVTISKKLPSKIILTIEERKPKYMLQFADSYVYVNNQGYMLEISNEKLDIPILIGFTTDLSNIKAGNRINIDDLKKMDMVIKIYETAKSNDLGNLVTKIDISNEKNYTLILESEGKKVYLGDCSDLNTRILYLKAILEKFAGRNGEIFLNIDLNSQDAYFRPSSN